MYYHTKFGRFRSNRLGVSRVSQKFRDAEPRPLGRGGMCDPLEIGPPDMCDNTKFGQSRLNRSSVIMEICHFDPSRPTFQGQRSLEPTRIDWPPMTSY